MGESSFAKPYMWWLSGCCCCRAVWVSCSVGLVSLVKLNGLSLADSVMSLCTSECRRCVCRGSSCAVEGTRCCSRPSQAPWHCQTLSQPAILSRCRSCPLTRHRHSLATCSRVRALFEGCYVSLLNGHVAALFLKAWVLRGDVVFAICFRMAWCLTRYHSY